MKKCYMHFWNLENAEIYCTFGHPFTTSSASYALNDLQLFNGMLWLTWQIRLTVLCLVCKCVRVWSCAYLRRKQTAFQIHSMSKSMATPVWMCSVNRICEELNWIPDVHLWAGMCAYSGVLCVTAVLRYCVSGMDVQWFLLRLLGTTWYFLGIMSDRPSMQTRCVI